MLDFLKEILKEKKEAPNLFKRNLIKEYLQILVLSFLYSKKNYRRLVFYGGSCLRYCFNLPRLSEDLDFVNLERKVNLGRLADDLERFFKKKLGIKINTKIQKFRIYLKLPLLYDLGLVQRGESNFLMLKVEIFRDFAFCKNYKIEIIPLFRFGESILVRTFDLPTLMATKIRAVLKRKWEKTNKTGKVLAKIKGRDYYDLMWYLEKGIEPNFKCIEGIKTKEEFKEKLLLVVGKIDPKSIKFDLEGLIEDRNLIEDLGNNIKKILMRQLKHY